MLVNPHTLSLITTHRCTAACDHCCFSCTPDVQDHIPIPNLHRYIDEATEVESIRVVVFTGGECFLLGNNLDQLMKRASSHGYYTRFVSNGYWAVSPAAARRRLEKLLACGLTEANFSTGDQHAAWVKPEYVRNGLLAACELGITALATIELFQESTFPLDDFLSHPDIERYINERKLAIKLAPWMKFKGKSALSFNKNYLDAVKQWRTPEGGGCKTALKVISISPRQQLFACCGLPVEEIEELHLGSLLDASIKQVLSRAPDDFIKIWIHLYGPDAVIRYARQFDPSIPAADETAHVCDACRHMYQNKRIREIVMQHPPPNMKEVMEYYMQGMLIPPTDMKRSQTTEIMSRLTDTIPVLRQTHAMATSPCCAK